MKPTVLFVDDEPHLLQGLRRSLRRMREEWDMLFADGGRQALDQFGGARIDVVVSDMRMPGMDGAQLLEEVARRQPRTIRIVLSGQTDEEDAFRLLGTSHQFLSKPSDIDILIETVRQTLTFRDLVADEELQSRVSGIRTLPIAADSHDALVAELESPEPSIPRIVEIASNDMALTARFLQIANSGYFGVGQPVSNLSQALNPLGIERIKRIVLDHGLFGGHGEGGPDDAFFRRLTKHGRSCASLAKDIAAVEEQRRGGADCAFVAGLLRDIGALILAARNPQYAGMTADGSGARRLEAERRSHGADHAAVGAYLAALWGLPEPIAQVIAFHHNPRDCPGQPFGVLTAVHLADCLAQPPDGAAPEQLSPPILDTGYLDSIGASDRLARWIGRRETALQENDRP